MSSCTPAHFIFVLCIKYGMINRQRKHGARSSQSTLFENGQRMRFFEKLSTNLTVRIILFNISTGI